jgi:hypothetical protein
MVRAFDIVVWSCTDTCEGSRGPAILDDFTASFGYKFSDASGTNFNLSISIGMTNLLVQVINGPWPAWKAFRSCKCHIGVPRHALVQKALAGR